MAAEPMGLASFIIVLGGVAFGLAAGVWAYRLARSVRADADHWRVVAQSVDAKLARLEAVFDAQPGVVLVWEDEGPVDDAGWGAPGVYGSTIALSPRFDLGEADDPARLAERILDELADWPAETAGGEVATLRARIADLRRDGAPFSVTIAGPAGRLFEADGRPSGARALVWLSETSGKRKETSVVDALARDPETFRDLLDKTPYPLWLMSPDLELTWANAAFLAAIETPDLDAALTENAALDAGVRDQARKARADGVRVDEVRGVVVAGAHRQLAISLFPIEGGGGGVAIDMTREQEARADLERYVSAQGEALDHLDDAVAIFNADKELVFSNRAFATLFRLSDAERAGRPRHGEILDRLRERSLLPHQNDYSQWKKDELARYAEIDGVFPDENWTMPDERELRVSRLRHPLGGLMFIFVDITEEVTLRRHFNNHIAVQRGTLDRLNEGVAVFGLDGRLRLRNEAFERMWRLPASLVEEGAAFDDIVKHCLPLYHDRRVWTELKAGITDITAREPLTRVMKRSDKAIFRCISRPLPDGATVIAFHDETAERNLEDALQQGAEALETATRVKRNFVAHVSYQLRVPLQTVLGYSELLAATAKDTLPPKQADQLDMIVQASDELNRFVDDVLDIAAIEAETFELELAPTNLPVALESAVKLVQTRAEDARVTVRIQEPAEEAGHLLADEKRLRQVVLNLVLNALEHSKVDGEIVVGAEREGAMGARVWVADNGEGVDQEKQARVFDTFEAGVGGGAGLGLALAREIVQLHGGWVEFTSERGEGARVTCHFPGTPPARQERRADQPKLVAAPPRLTAEAPQPIDEAV